MNEPTTTTTTETPLDAWRRGEDAARARFDAALPANKAAVFAALDAAGIARVVVPFDGAGDDGALGDVVACDAAGADRALPEVAVAFADADARTAGAAAGERPLREAVEDLAWALLGRTHGGWEDGDGAFGEVAFDGADRAIRLEVNVRFTDSDLHEHTF